MIAQNLGCWIYNTIILLLTCISLATADIKTEQYTPLHTSATELGKSINELYPSAHTSAQGNQLFIRAEASEIQEIIELLPIMDKPIQSYALMFSSSNQSAGKSYGTKTSQFENKQYNIKAGEPLRISFTTETLQLRSISRFYTNFGDKTVTANQLEITIKPINNNKLVVNYQMLVLDNGNRNIVSNSLEASTGEWIALGGEHVSTQSRTKVYSTNQSSKLSLFVKIN